MKAIHKQISIVAAIFLVLICVVLVACTVDPVKTAQTPEQKAFAAYGMFVVFEEQAGKLASDPATPTVVKTNLRLADSVAKPAMDELYTATQVVISMEVALGSGVTTQAQVDAALLNLSSLIISTQPKIDALVTAVKGK